MYLFIFWMDGEIIRSFRNPDNTKVAIGGFNWNMIFTWHHSEFIRGDPTIPVQSPTMAGGLFSIHKDFFQRLGRYDPGFDIWGGENLELSFKSWMCGGRLEILPCSHVGHIFRSRSPYKWRPGTNVVKKNSIRLAQVWLDEYKQIYFDRINNKLDDYGNITERLDLRIKLQCRRWILAYMFYV